MQVEFKKHEHFIIALTYKKDEAGWVKDGSLHYIPRDVFDNHDTFDELVQNEEALQKIGCKSIQGNTLTRLKQRMEEAENQLLTIHEAINHTKRGVHSGSCY